MHCTIDTRAAPPGRRRAAWLLALAPLAALAAPDARAAADLEASLEITASAVMPDGVDHVEYELAVENTGDAHAQAVKVLARLPNEFVGPQWTCVADGGASCGLPSGSGDILFETEMPAGAVVRLALVTGVHDPRQLGVELVLETVTASAEDDLSDNVARVTYQRCSATPGMPGNGDPAGHACTFQDSFEPR